MLSPKFIIKIGFKILFYLQTMWLENKRYQKASAELNNNLLLDNACIKNHKSNAGINFKTHMPCYTIHTYLATTILKHI